MIELAKTNKKTACAKYMPYISDASSSASIRFSTPNFRHNSFGDCVYFSIAEFRIRKNGDMFEIELLDSDYSNPVSPIEKQLLRERKYTYTLSPSGSVTKSEYQRKDIDFDTKSIESRKSVDQSPGIITNIKVAYLLKMHKKYLNPRPVQLFVDLKEVEYESRLCRAASIHSQRY